LRAVPDRTDALWDGANTTEATWHHAVGAPVGSGMPRAMAGMGGEVARPTTGTFSRLR
jgi:hypothetical protein